MDVKALDPLERAEHGRHEQLCVPLVPKSTYYYLSAVPELLELIAERLDAASEVER